MIPTSEITDFYLNPLTKPSDISEYKYSGAG